MAAPRQTKVLTDVLFSAHPTTKGEYLLTLGFRVGYDAQADAGFAHRDYFSGDRETSLRIAEAILQFLEVPPSDRVWESLAQIQALLKELLEAQRSL